MSCPLPVFYSTSTYFIPVFDYVTLKESCSIYQNCSPNEGTLLLSVAAENLAAHQPSLQSGTHGAQHPHLAVDGGILSIYTRQPITWHVTTPATAINIRTEEDAT